MKRNLFDYLLLFGFAGTLIAFDQWTKALVRTHLAFQEFWVPWDWLLPYARIVHWKNTGAAFGMLPNFSDVFTVLAIIVSLAILYYFPQVPRQDYTLRLAMGLQLGGAVGNLIDRVTIGHVTDFISLGAFPVFNVADASISVGVVVLILGVWYKERQQALMLANAVQSSAGANEATAVSSAEPAAPTPLFQPESQEGPARLPNNQPEEQPSE